VYILYILIYFVLYLSLQESYTWSNINACVHNIIIGQMWIEQVTEGFERINIGNVLPRGLVKSHLLLTLLGVATVENRRTRRKPVVFGRVKLEAFFSHGTEVKL
jgi:hypothetical protein